jgi:hypothetical protein
MSQAKTLNFEGLESSTDLQSYVEEEDKYIQLLLASVTELSVFVCCVYQCIDMCLQGILTCQASIWHIYFSTHSKDVNKLGFEA